MLQRLVEHINYNTELLWKDKTLQTPFAYAEVIGVSRCDVDGGQLTVTIMLRNHFKGVTPQQPMTYKETRLDYITDIEGLKDGDGELTPNEVHGMVGMFIAIIHKKPFVVNLETGESCGVSQIPAQTPFVAYVGKANVKMMNKIYVGAPKLDLTDGGIVQHLTDTMLGYSHSDTKKIAKVVEAVAKKGGQPHMQVNKFKTIATTPIPYWRKDSSIGGVKVRVYASPFNAMAVDAKGQTYFIYDKLKFTLDSNYSIVSRLDMPVEDKKALLVLLEMTDLRKKLPKLH